MKNKLNVSQLVQVGQGAIFQKTRCSESALIMLGYKFRVLTAFVAACLLAIFGLTALKWPGSFYAYSFMTFAFWGLLAVGIRHLSVKNVGFALLAILLWVGYWLKLSIHLLNGMPWVEPIGRFDFSARGWDSVAIVSAIGALAIALVGLLWRFPLDRDQAGEMKTRIIWRPGVRTLVYLFIVTVTITVVSLNEIYSLSHGGLRPAVGLVWPLQGLFNWMFVIGIALLILVVFHLDAISGHSMILATLLFMGAVTSLALSQYSRGIAALQSLPLLICLLLWHKHITGLNKRRIIAIIAIMFFGIMVSIVGSQELRIQTQPIYEATQKDSNTRGLPVLLSHLVIDRWVGLEGVMAVVAYPDKGIEFFQKMLVERRTKDKVDTFTAEISQAGFYDTSKYHFATIPGAFAFLYYSNSLIIVFLGAMLLGATVIASERLIQKTTENVFLSTQVGFFSAMLVIQLGAGGFVQPGSVLIFTLASATMAGLVGRYYFGRVKAE